MKLKPKKSKTHFVAYVAASIDGRISLAKQTKPDWTSSEDWKFFQQGLSKCDVVVAGRNTYIAAKNNLDKRNTIVLTSRVIRPKVKESVTFVNPKHTKLISLFKNYKTVGIVGGARVYQTMLTLGLLNELFVTIEPYIFGRGQVMFEGGKHTNNLRLVKVKKLNSRGTLLLKYER
jgi:dihydrofolate reductase